MIAQMCDSVKSRLERKEDLCGRASARGSRVESGEERTGIDRMHRMVTQRFPPAEYGRALGLLGRRGGEPVLKVALQGYAG